MTVAELVLVRHGESRGNVAAAAAHAADAEVIEIDRRDADVELSEVGEEQARALGGGLRDLLADDRPTVVWSSPYVRARQTAEIALAAAGADVVYAPVSVTGLVVAFQVDDANGRPVTSMKLNARLVAKLVTASYRSGADPAVIKNPFNIFRDPEFLALNPGVDWPSGLKIATCDPTRAPSDSARREPIAIRSLPVVMLDRLPITILFWIVELRRMSATRMPRTSTASARPL